MKVGRIYSHSASAGLDLGSERACANTPAPAPHKQSPESTGARWLSLRTEDSPAPKRIYCSTFKLTLSCWDFKCFRVMERILTPASPAPLAYCFLIPPARRIPPPPHTKIQYLCLILLTLFLAPVQTNSLNTFWPPSFHYELPPPQSRYSNREGLLVNPRRRSSQNKERRGRNDWPVCRLSFQSRDRPPRLGRASTLENMD